MPEALRKRLRLTAEDALPPVDFELNSATDAMSAFEHICLAIPASGALIAVRDAAGLHCVGSLGDAPEVGSRLPPDFGIALECLQTGSVVSADFSDDAQRILSVGMTTEGVAQIRSAVALPMRTAGVIIGLIAVFSRRESAFQSHDIKALARIADFWGPVMADEWFPDGIPAAIVADSPASTVATEIVETVEAPQSFPAPVIPFSHPNSVGTDNQYLEGLHEEALSRGDSRADDVRGEKPSDSGSSTSAETATDFDNADDPFGVRRSRAAFDRSSAPESSTVGAALESQPIAPEELVNPELEESRRPANEVSPAEIGAIAAASNRFQSPIFLAPAEPIPPEAFHPGGPQRQTWLIVLAVFLIVLLPFWYLKSHSIRTSAVAKGPALATSTKPPPAANADAGTIARPSVNAPATAANKQNSTTPTKNSEIASPQTSKSPATDDDLPKPLPDLNTPPPTKSAAAPSTAPKPSLPALLSRILKSPKASSAKSESTAPTAPDLSSTPQASSSNDSATNESAASAATSAAMPSEPEAAPELEPAQPISGAGALQPPNFALAKTLKAHSGWVSSLAFSPTETLASGSWDRTVKFWNLTTGREVRAVSEKLKQVQAIAFSRDGKFLAAEDTTYTVAIFDAATGVRIRELPTDKAVPSVGISWVYSIAFSPDGRWLAAAVDDKTVRIWDVATGAKIRDLIGPRRPVVYAAFSPNGELVATGNDEKSIQIWNVASGAPTTTLTGHKKVINAVAFSPDGKFLASASGDKTIRIWDAATGKHIRTLSGHQAAVSSISFSPDGRWLASGSWDKTVRIWNVANGKEMQTLRPDARAIYSVTFDPRGRWLAAGSEDGGVEIWQWNAAASNANPESSNPTSADPASDGAKSVAPATGNR